MDSYSDMLQRMQVKPNWQNAIDKAANVIIAHKATYKAIEADTGVPWIFIGCLHMRESDFNFKTHLHNGDPLSGKTYHVPRGRPPGNPPFTFQQSADDALRMEGFADKTDWTLENICERAERYNGLGYKRMGIPSPYLWSGTNIYTRGKYVADGEFSSSAVDPQLGVIPVYLRTQDLAHEHIIRTNSRKLNIISKVRTGIKTLIGVVGGLFSMDSMGVLKEWFTTANGIIDGKMLVALAIGGGLVWVLINTLDRMMMEDAKAGNWTPSGLATPSAPPLNDAGAKPDVTTSV